MLGRLGPDRVRKDLLVGFDPVAAFLERLEQRFGAAATFCADGLGGAGIAVKWLPKVRTGVHGPRMHGLCMHIGVHMRLRRCNVERVVPLLQVVRAQPLEVPLAHMVKPVNNGAEPPSGKTLMRQKRSGALAVVLDAEGVLAEMQTMGAGLVEEVLSTAA